MRISMYRMRDHENGKVDLECNLFLAKTKLLKQCGLNERIRQHTLGILNRHFQAVFTCKHNSSLQTYNLKHIDTHNFSIYVTI